MWKFSIPAPSNHLGMAEEATIMYLRSTHHSMGYSTAVELAAGMREMLFVFFILVLIPIHQVYYMNSNLLGNILVIFDLRQNCLLCSFVTLLYVNCMSHSRVFHAHSTPLLIREYT